MSKKLLKKCVNRKECKFSMFRKKEIQIGSKGTNVYIGDDCIIAGANNILIGNNVSIGARCIFFSTRAKIIIGNYVMIAPNCSFVSGNHRTDIVGEYMFNVTDDLKLPKNDRDIMIDDDVWIGIGCIILAGVRIGRGSIVGAGCVIRKDVPPYSIYINDNNIKRRFTNEQIIEHEKRLVKKYGKQ